MYNERLDNANKLYKSKKYNEALEIYETIFNESPDAFDYWNKVRYCWAIYRVHIKDSNNEMEISENVELITELIPQGDLNEKPVCIYTISVFKIIDLLYKEMDFFNLEYWLNKLNPKFLDEKVKGNYPSNKDKYYSRASKTYFECGDFERCIEVSREALHVLTNFSKDSDVWYNWRIAKSLKELNKNEEAIEYLNEIITRKNDWFIRKEMAENYFTLKDNGNALKFAGEAVLSNGFSSKKVNLYYLIYQILQDENPEVAFKHAELYLALKMENNSQIAEDINELYIDEENLDIISLEKEIKEYWMDFKFKDQVLQYGTITKIFEHGKSGFITSNDYESVYFNKLDFEGEDIREGMYVSYFTEKTFDKSKNKESIKAIYIKEE